MRTGTTAGRSQRPAAAVIRSVIDSGSMAPSSESHAHRLEDLAARARTGDRRALDELLRLDYDRLHAVCWTILREREAALEATQEAAVAVARGIVRFDGYSRYTTWAYRIAANAALDELRRRRRRPVASLDRRSADDRSLDDRPGDGPTEGELVVESLSIRAAMDRLPEEQHVALVLRHDLGLDYDEIARIIRAPVGTVRSRVSRARATLRDLLQGPAEDDEPATIRDARNTGEGTAVERTRHHE